MSDAQRLVDFLVHLVDEKYILSQYKPDGMGKAAQLVLNIFLWVPILPRSLFLNVKRVTQEYPRLSNVRDACQSVLMWRVLDQNYVHLEINLKGASLLIPADLDMKEKLQQVLPLDSITVIELMLDAARAIQYLHSMSVARPSGILRKVYLDLSFRPKIRIAAQFLGLINPCTGPTTQHPLSRSSVFDFGYFFYAVRLHSTFSFSIKH
ncbi:hypothetical protein M378DRAFT_761168 [Amanita muscaria Koide BX008]|uniref:Uncharacterized protein n=1 Tax=Amanita muscaria (strain Koide BX008) TaxID=946122 RepID=A0A0C2X060_AMAMK|nr:hypothetical protein M378DRAFT_761168 [Amanita muscaria Koide BX008]